MVSFNVVGSSFRVFSIIDFNPIPGFAAAALYIGCKASQEGVDAIQTQRDLANYAGLTEVTVRNRIRDIRRIIIIKMPDAIEEEPIAA